MNRHMKRKFTSLTKRRLRERRATLLRLNLRRLEIQESITKIQAKYLQNLLSIYNKQKIQTSAKAVRVANILMKPRCKSLIEIHEEIVNPKKITKPKKKSWLSLLNKYKLISFKMMFLKFISKLLNRPIIKYKQKEKK